MFKYIENYEGATVKYNDGELPYTENSLQLETIEYNNINIDGFNKECGVKQQFTIPKVFNVNRLALYKCIVDLSSLQGCFGTVQQLLLILIYVLLKVVQHKTYSLINLRYLYVRHQILN
ncbi:Hypothetical_protein [Hexamita inflata]|uniref:Hypothetical_protein n=1 Tax=Hexamita inflata TaxID=28002 RepID=A0AA86RJX6_9EUKA|nr:Hypothetical protein HINF_LOCUS62618 [Hexamita inflata]